MSETDDRIGSDRPLGAAPTDIANPELRKEIQRAIVWVSVVGLAMLAVYIAQPLLVIFGAMVFAAMLDGGARLIGRVLKIPRGLRIGLVLLLAIGFLVWLSIFAGTQITQEAAELPALVTSQVNLLLNWLQDQGFAIRHEDVQQVAGTLMSGVGTITKAIGGFLGGITTLVLVLIIGIYVALEPRLYERGVAWMLPSERRSDFFIVASRMAATMRRLMAGRVLGMVVEGIFTWLMLSLYDVPMAALLGILTGLLAFIPNIGAVVSGVLMVLVGFSGGVDTGVYTVFVYFAVQTIDGYVIIPLIAKKTVDLAPALVLGAQLIMGILFGVVGLFLADPLMAMIKVVLERRSERAEAEEQLAKGAEPDGA
ncbi:AI-2E family transporter [Croceibacterium xixiisoli]|uniref:AI-2E family transporter n=1 Tax=Croceibacterium xixiisoli TaxID=1476466 RepID=UPI001F3C1ABC|nr:AI-2E family transporter [Croceibacterium xixiisoli]